MKIKTIKRGIVPVLLVALLLVCTSIISVGAATNKTYLDTMGYSSFDNGGCAENGGAPFSGKDKHENQCINAYQFYINSNYYSYANSDEVDERGYASYTMNFKLDKKFDSFNFSLTSGERIGADIVDIAVLGDGNHLYGTGVTENTNQIPVSFSVENVDVLTFKLTAPSNSSIYKNNYIILNNAYFTSNGSTPVPTERPTQPTTEKPTQAPTKPVVNPTSAPATEVTTAADTKATTATDSTKATSSVKPIDVNPQTTPTSKVSTADTAKPNTSNTTGTKGSTTGNGFVKTGDIPFIVLIALAVIGAGTGVVFFIRKKKFMK